MAITADVIASDWFNHLDGKRVTNSTLTLTHDLTDDLSYMAL